MFKAIRILLPSCRICLECHTHSGQWKSVAKCSAWGENSAAIGSSLGFFTDFRVPGSKRGQFLTEKCFANVCWCHISLYSPPLCLIFHMYKYWLQKVRKRIKWDNPSWVGEGGTNWESSVGGSDVKESACNVGDPGSIPGWGRSPGEGNGNPFQYSCLENPKDGGAWQATVHGVTKSETQLSGHYHM